MPKKINKPDVGRHLAPETLMMSHGYRPELSEGALKCPIFQTSTFVFKTPEEGKGFFELAYGLRDREPGEQLGLIYSRLNNPDLEILEDRLALWDEAEEAAVFESGLAAISTAFLEFCSPGDLLVHSTPLYGGTHHFVHRVLPRYGVEAMGFSARESEEEIARRINATGKAGKVAAIFIESPANPTNELIDMEMAVRLARRFSTDDRKVVAAIDNTFMGPMWQKPLRHGMDLVLYSATKFIGGHSDVIAGSCSGSHAMVARMKGLRSFLGNMASPWTGWLLMRSLETLRVRTDRMTHNAQHVAKWLAKHPKVRKVHYLGQIEETDAQHAIYKSQCLSPGSMISFDVAGGEAEAFRVLGALRVIHLAVSLGGTESLAEHPATMTHVDIDPADRERMGITGGLVRLSIGVENVEDLIWDLDQALSTI